MRLLLILFIVLTPVLLFAEAIYMKDGRIIYGKIVRQSHNSIRVKNRYATLTLQKKDIDKINYEKGLGTITAFFKNGKTISGTLISINSKKIVIREKSGGNIEHTIPRNQIENLYLEKFDDRKKNELGIAGGLIQTMGEMKEYTPLGYMDFSLYYLRSLSISPNMHIGASFSYIYAGCNDKSPLKNPALLFNTVLASWQYRYPLFSLFSGSAWAGNLQFAIQLDAGISIITLKEEDNSTSGNYVTFQPGAGVGYYISDSIYLSYYARLFYVYQSEQPFYALRHRVGVGWMF